MPDLLEKTGKIVFLRAHDLGTAYGPPNDQLDVEAVFILNALGDGAYGFQLRNDDNLPARQAMFSLLRDAFVHNLTVITDYLIDPGKINGTAFRVALIRQTGPGSLPGSIMSGGQPQALARKSPTAKKAATAKRAPRRG